MGREGYETAVDVDWIGSAVRGRIGGEIKRLWPDNTSVEIADPEQLAGISETDSER